MQKNTRKENQANYNGNFAKLQALPGFHRVLQANLAQKARPIMCAFLRSQKVEERKDDN